MEPQNTFKVKVWLRGQNQLIAQVRCICENDKEKWPEVVHLVAFSHKISENVTTGFAQFKNHRRTRGKGSSPVSLWIREGIAWTRVSTP